MKHKSVLIVEDDCVIALDHKLSAEAAGWEVIGPVMDVQGTLSLLQTERPAVALLDLYLGGSLVTPVAEVLKATGIPFVMCCATDELELVGGEVFAGVVNIGKPVRESCVLRALEESLTA